MLDSLTGLFHHRGLEPFPVLKRVAFPPEPGSWTPNLVPLGHTWLFSANSRIICCVTPWACQIGDKETINMAVNKDHRGARCPPSCYYALLPCCAMPPVDHPCMVPKRNGNGWWLSTNNGIWRHVNRTCYRTRVFTIQQTVAPHSLPTNYDAATTRLDSRQDTLFVQSTWSLLHLLHTIWTKYVSLVLIRP